jgi:hypothetical protein
MVTRSGGPDHEFVHGERALVDEAEGNARPARPAQREGQRRALTRGQELRVGVLHDDFEGVGLFPDFSVRRSEIRRGARVAVRSAPSSVTRHAARGWA